MTKRRLILFTPVSLAAIVAAWSLSAAAQSATPSDPNSNTSTKPAGTSGFLHQATRGNSMEAALAEVGVRKAQNPELKAFSQQMQQDHLQLDKQLKTLDQQYGVAIDEPLPKRDTRELARMEKLDGAKFDQDLATAFLKEHAKAIREYQRATQGSLPQDVKQFAQSSLPKLQEHFQHAQTIAKDVGVSQTTISSISTGAESEMGGTGTAQEPEPGVGSGAKTKKGAGAKQLEQNPNQPRQ